MAHFQILDLDTIGKKEANRQRDEWVKLIQAQQLKAEMKGYDDERKSSEKTRGDNGQVHQFAIVSGVQQMDNLEEAENVTPGLTGTLYLSKSDGNIIFTSSNDKSTHGDMSAVKNVSDVIDTFEGLKNLVEKDGSGKSSRLSHRGSSSNNGM